MVSTHLKTMFKCVTTTKLLFYVKSVNFVSSFSRLLVRIMEHETSFECKQEFVAKRQLYSMFSSLYFVAQGLT